ncbi:hypothetical protein AB0F15_28595 [Amycolatopsis sp. NPDC026612]|uniref:hypothetical protein n=1 Tax=Amycolatopsis sp. NPDC026612 TaxID=3155466 RepID=UPI0033D91BBD
MPRLRTVVIDHSFGCWVAARLPLTVEEVLAASSWEGVTGVLVSLQRTGEDRPLPAAAQHLLGLLRSWGPGPDHLTGLTLAGITLPSRLGPRFVDALVFTRYGVVVIAAHEPDPAEWPGPGNRTGAAVAAAKSALAGHEGGRHVTGLVAVVPRPVDAPGNGSGAAEIPAGDRPQPVAIGSDQAGASVVAGSEPMVAPSESWPERSAAAAVPGVAVVLADSRGLRRIIAQHNRWRTVWSADDVLDACYALSLAHLAPPRAVLIADGFPARLPALSRLPELPAVVPVLPALPVLTEPPPPAAADDDPGPWIPVPRGPGSAAFPRPRLIRQVPWGLVFVLTVLVAVGVVAAVFVAQVFHGS